MSKYYMVLRFSLAEITIKIKENSFFNKIFGKLYVGLFHIVFGIVLMDTNWFLG